MQFPFVYSEIVNGAVVGSPFEGKAIIERDGDTDDWAVTKVEVDGFWPVEVGQPAKWVDIELPEDHWLFKKIMLELGKPDVRFEIDLAWNQHLADCKANREAA